jgi:hypothetical protein
MSWRFIENPKEYGILYASPAFPKGHKLYWLNYAFGQMPKDLSEKLTELSDFINNSFSDKIIIPLDNNIKPGIVFEPEVIEEIANLVYNGFNSIFKELTGDNNCYVVVWSIGEMEQPENLTRQETRVVKTPTLHNIDPYPVVVKVGHKLDKLTSTQSLIKPGLYKV